MKQNIFILTLALVLFGCNSKNDTTISIICPDIADNQIKLAAKEIRKYVYLRSDELLKIEENRPRQNNAIVLTVNPELDDQEYALKTSNEGDKRTLTISGGTPLAVLYGAYHFAETLGVKFSLHGDLIPDEKISFNLGDLDETHSPIFEQRGILPFHDFAEGPDWWQVDDYKAYMDQMTKMKMNFIGLHAYPNVPWGPEPTIWMGLPEDVNDDGTVKFSYPTSYHMTERLNGYGEESGSKKRWWGYSAVPTSDFSVGASQLFEVDNYGSESMKGYKYRNLTPETSNEVFNATGKMLNNVFSYAKNLGIKTAVGTEAPILLADELKEHLQKKGMDPDAPETISKIYEGMVKRIKNTYPADYYWAWTPEDWLSPQPKSIVDKTINEFQMIMDAIKKQGDPFTFATCGWVLGPVENNKLFDSFLDKKSPISGITSWLGAARLNSTFSEIDNRPKWAIPWVEDDTGMISPQLWTGRLRQDILDAYNYGCNGLIGIHWRTKILAPNFSTLAEAGWNMDWKPVSQNSHENHTNKEGSIDGKNIIYAINEIEGTKEDSIYESTCSGLKKYRMLIPNGKYNVTLKFSEMEYQEPKKRVFDVRIQGELVAKRLDIYSKAGAFKAFDITTINIEITNGILDISFDKIIGDSFISGISIEGKTNNLNQIEGTKFVRKINIGGTQWKDYERDLGEFIEVFNERRDLPSEDFYLKWCSSEFGSEVSDKLAKIFTNLDSGGPLEVNSFASAIPRNIPIPNVWIDGPGGIQVDSLAWSEVKKEYEFVNEISKLKPLVKGNGNLSRFEYWLNSFKYLKKMGEISCARGALDYAFQVLIDEKHPFKQQSLARDQVLPLRIKLSRLWEELITLQLMVTDTPGGLGTIANLEQHTRKNLNFLDMYDAVLKKILKEEFSKDVNVTNKYLGDARIIVPTVRSTIYDGEFLRLKVIFLDNAKPEKTVLHWRELGEKNYNDIYFEHLARGVYEAVIRNAEKDFEYYIEATSSIGGNLIFPATAPEINQVVLKVPFSK